MIADLRVSDSGDGPNYYPVIEFRTKSDEAVRFEGISTSPAPAVGQSVPILYREDTPQNARIDSFVQRWLFPAIFTPVGILLIVGGRRFIRQVSNLSRDHRVE